MVIGDFTTDHIYKVRLTSPGRILKNVYRLGSNLFRDNSGLIRSGHVVDLDQQVDPGTISKILQAVLSV